MWRDHVTHTLDVHLREMTHASVRHDSFIHVTWPIHMRHTHTSNSALCPVLSTSHVTHMMESRHTYIKSGTLFVFFNESCHAYEGSIPHIHQLWHLVRFFNESCNTYEGIMSRVRDTWCHTYGAITGDTCIMSQIQLCPTQIQLCLTQSLWYGVATVSRIDKIIGLFCKRDLQKRRYFAKETYNLIDPTDRSHSVSDTSQFWYLCHKLILYVSQHMKEQHHVYVTDHVTHMKESHVTHVSYHKYNYIWDAQIHTQIHTQIQKYNSIWHTSLMSHTHQLLYLWHKSTIHLKQHMKKQRHANVTGHVTHMHESRHTWRLIFVFVSMFLHNTATRCNSLQHTATHYVILDAFSFVHQ